MSVIEKFMPSLMDKEEEGNITPIIQTPEATFSYIKHNNLYIVSVTRTNANIALVFSFLHKVVQVNRSVFILILKEFAHFEVRTSF